MKNRRAFIGQSAIGLFGALPLLTSHVTPFHKNIQSQSTEVDKLYPTTDPYVIKEVVGAAHANFDKIKELVSPRPELAKATFDWGWGDWESALGAAAHMGRKDIAEFLIEHGARPNIFTYAMLGKINAVKAIIADHPGIQKQRGPHGFTLMHHANMRLLRKNVEGQEKKQQEELVAFLKSIGDADIKAPALDISPEEQKVYLGKYTFGTGEDEFFEVNINRQGSLSMGRGSYFGRALLKQDEHTFAPGGAPTVRITFDVVDDQAQSVTVHDPMPVIKATRH